MCAVSMIGDYYKDKWHDLHYVVSPTITSTPYVTSSNITFTTDAEVAKLREEVLEMKELLKRALKYDKDHNEPHCEMEDKVATLKAVAEAMGVSLDDIFPPSNNLIQGTNSLQCSSQSNSLRALTTNNSVSHSPSHS